MTYQLDKAVAQKLKDFFEPFDFIDKVVIFGSRAKHNANPKSDIDLCIYSLQMSDAQFSKLKLALDELPILYKIDVVHFEKSNEALRANIEKDGKLLFVKKVLLENILKIKTGKFDANHEDKDGKYDFFTCAIKPLKANTYSFDDEVIILPGNGANVGEVLYYKGKLEAYQRTYVLHDIQAEVKYLFYFLKTYWKRHTSKNEVGSATNYIKLGHIQKFELPFPSLTKQQQIAQTLDKAQELIELRKAAIQKLNELAQSIFIDMFGDPVENPMKWEIKFLEDVVQKDCPLSYGIVQPGEEFFNGVLVVRPVDLNNSKVCVKNLKRVDPLISNKFKKTLLHGDEILLSVRGTTGVLGYANEKLKNANVTRGIVPIRFDDKYNKYFAFGLLLTKQMQRVIQEKTYGATLQQINLSEVRKLKCINPPIKLQNQFAQTIEKIEAQKSLYESELTHLQAAFDALMAQSFEG